MVTCADVKMWADKLVVSLRELLEFPLPNTRVRGAELHVDKYDMKAHRLFWEVHKEFWQESKNRFEEMKKNWDLSTPDSHRQLVLRANAELSLPPKPVPCSGEIYWIKPRVSDENLRSWGGPFKVMDQNGNSRFCYDTCGLILLDKTTIIDCPWREPESN